MSHLEVVKGILTEILSLGDRGKELDADSLLLGNIPEFDSMAVVATITALEEEYGFIVDDDEISAETFETVGSLVEFIESKT